jgi:type I restriction enzyme S subunit
MSTAVNESTLDEAGDLPAGWAAASLPSICEINPRRTQADGLSPDAEVTFVPMPAVDADAGSILEPQVRRLAEVRKGYTTFRRGDVIFAKITPCMENGKAAVVRELRNDLGFGSTEFHVLRPTTGLLPEYLFFFIRQESFRRTAAAEMTGSVGQKRVPAQFLEEVVLPLPPFAEQKRIVAKVEELLADVNAARDRLASVPALLKRFRQSVLAAACSADLSQEWRAKHRSDAWQETSVDGLSVFVTSGSRGWAQFYSKDGPTFIRSQDINTDRLLMSDAAHVRPPRNSEGARTRVCRNDILITITGANVTRCAVVDCDPGEAYVSQHVALIRLKTPENARFLHLWLTCDGRGRGALREAAYGGGKPGLNLDNIRELPVVLPTQEEQKEIVRRVDAFFKLANLIEENVATARTRVDKLTQSILAKAFRGELVPTEAELARRERRSYEPAAALLERGRAARSKSALTVE